MSWQDSVENSAQFSDDDVSQGYPCTLGRERQFSPDLEKRFKHQNGSAMASEPMSVSRRHYSLADSLYEEGDESECGETKRKSRNLSEKKRRDQFNKLIHELLSMVSFTNRKMDKTTVLKTAIAFLRKQNELTAQSRAHEIKETWKPSFITNDEFMQIMLDASNAFLLVITKVGNILYASENVTSVMGYKSSDLLNQSIFDYLYKDDISVLYSQLAEHVLATSDNIADYQQEENQMNLMFRMREATSPPAYHLLSCKGCFRFCSNKDVLNSETGLPLKSTTCYCCVVRRSNSPCMHELSYLDENKNEFISRQSTEWKFLFLDHRGPLLVGYQPFEILGTSMYEYIHPDDLEMLANSHKELSETGKSQSCYYRFLTKGEQWLWLKSSYYISYNQWNSKPEFIVCTNTVVSLTVAQAALQEKAQKRLSQTSRHNAPELSGCTSTVTQSKKSEPEPVTTGQADDTSNEIPVSLLSKNQSPTTDPIPGTIKSIAAKFSLPNPQPEPGPSGLQVSSCSSSSNMTKVSTLISSLPLVTAVPSTIIKTSLRGAHLSQKIPTSGPVTVIGAPALSNQVLTVRQIHLTKAQELLFSQLKTKHENLLSMLLKQQDELRGVVNMLNLSQDTFLLPVNGQDQAAEDQIHQLQLQDQQQLAMQQQQQQQLLVHQQDVMPQEQMIQQHLTIQDQQLGLQEQHQMQQVLQETPMLQQQEEQMLQQQGEQLLQQQMLQGQSLLPQQGQQVLQQPVLQNLVQEQSLPVSQGQQVHSMQQDGQQMLPEQLVSQQQTLQQHGQQDKQTLIEQEQMSQQPTQILQQQPTQILPQSTQILPQPVAMFPVNIISPNVQNTNNPLIQIVTQQPRPGTPQTPLHFGQSANLQLQNLLQQPPR